MILYSLCCSSVLSSVLCAVLRAPPPPRLLAAAGPAPVPCPRPRGVPPPRPLLSPVVRAFARWGGFCASLRCPRRACIQGSGRRFPGVRVPRARPSPALPGAAVSVALRLGRDASRPSRPAPGGRKKPGKAGLPLLDTI